MTSMARRLIGSVFIVAAGATVDENERLWVQVVPLELIEEENLKLTVFLYHYCLRYIIQKI